MALTALPTDAQTFAIVRDVAAFWIWTDSDVELVDSTIPADAGEVHLVLDNYGTHKTPKVVRWFARHPRYHLHFTPTSGSW